VCHKKIWILLECGRIEFLEWAGTHLRFKHRGEMLFTKEVCSWLV